MDVHSCTGPMERKELWPVMQSGELMLCGELGNSSTLAVELVSL